MRSINTQNFTRLILYFDTYQDAISLILIEFFAQKFVLFKITHYICTVFRQHTF